MIKEIKLKIKISNRIRKHYNELGYICEIGDAIEIDPNDLPKGSHHIITAICESCSMENTISYHKYIENKKRRNYYGCKKCSQKKAKETNMELYGEINYMCTDEGKERVEKTMIENFGYKTNLIQPEHIEENKKIMFEKYGGEYTMTSPILNEKITQTLIGKFGVDSYSKTDIFKEKLSKSSWKHHILQKLNDYNIVNYKLNLNEQTIDIYCNKCLGYYTINSKNLYQRTIIQKSNTCTKCNPLNKHYSIGEKEVLNFIKNNYNGVVLENHRKLIKGELDIYLPDLNLSFEYNGLFWHSEINKPKNYHHDKFIKAREKGAHLVHIYEDDWLYKKEIIKSNILNFIKSNNNIINLDKYTISEIIDDKVIKEFVYINSLYKYKKSDIKIGLFDNKHTLISIITFNKLSDYNYELINLTSLINSISNNHLNNLLKYFNSKFKPTNIVVNIDTSVDINVYKSLGFKESDILEPDYTYVVNKKRISKFNFTKVKFIKNGFNNNLTLHEIMLEQNYYRLYDSGKIMLKYYKNQ